MPEQRLDPITAEAMQYFPESSGVTFPEQSWETLTNDERQAVINDIWNLGAEATARDRRDVITKRVPWSQSRALAQDSPGMFSTPDTERLFEPEEVKAKMREGTRPIPGAGGIYAGSPVTPQEPVADPMLDEGIPPLAPIPTTSRESEGMTISGPIGSRTGFPASPGVPSFEDSINEYVKVANARKNSALVEAEEEGRIRTQIRTQQAAMVQEQADHQIVIDKKRADIDRAFAEKKTIALYPGGGEGKDGTRASWVQDQKDVIADITKTEEQRDEAREALEKAQNPGGMKAVMGEWWQVALQMVGIALSGFASAKMGQDRNPALDFFFKILDRKQAEEERKAKRMERIAGLGIRESQLGLAREKEDFKRRQFNMAHTIDMMELGLEDIKVRYKSAEHIATIDQSIAGLRMRGQEVKGRLLQQEFATEMSGAIAQERTQLLREKAAAKDDPKLQPSGFGGLLYKPLPPGQVRQSLSGGERTFVRKEAIIYDRAKFHLDNLIRDSTDWRDGRLLDAAGKHLSWTDASKRMRGSYAEMIDILRDAKGWGARFEKTEEQRLIPGYLGRKDPADFGYFLNVLKGTRRGFEHAFHSVIDRFDMITPDMLRIQQEGGGQQQGRMHGERPAAQ